MTSKEVTELKASPGPISNFVAAVAQFLLDLSAKYGFNGTAMYDPLAMGAAIDPNLVTTQAMHVDVETKGEFTRGETVANRQGFVERNVLHGDRYVIEGMDRVRPNVQVCVDVKADQFLQMFVSRIKGK